MSTIGWLREETERLRKERVESSGTVHERMDSNAMPRSDRKMIRHVGNGIVEFPVYVPTLPPPHGPWGEYRSTWWAFPVIWLVWLFRGLRARTRLPALGRKVTVGDMISAHPPKAWRCSCGGTGVLTTWRGGVQGVQFCQRMLDAFTARYGGTRVKNAKGGPRWLKGMEPEKLVPPTQAARVEAR